MEVFGKRVLVKVVKTNPKVGSLYIPFRKDTTEAIVLDVGDEVEAGLKKSDRILYDIHAGMTIKWNSEEHLMFLMENEIIAKIEK